MDPGRHPPDRPPQRGNARFANHRSLAYAQIRDLWAPGSPVDTPLDDDRNSPSLGRVDFHCKPGHTAGFEPTNPDDLAVKTKAMAALPALGDEPTHGEQHEPWELTPTRLRLWFGVSVQT